MSTHTCVSTIPGLARLLEHANRGLEAAAVPFPLPLLGGVDLLRGHAAADQDVRVEVLARFEIGFTLGAPKFWRFRLLLHANFAWSNLKFMLKI